MRHKRSYRRADGVYKGMRGCRSTLRSNSVGTGWYEAVSPAIRDPSCGANGSGEPRYRGQWLGDGISRTIRGSSQIRLGKNECEHCEERVSGKRSIPDCTGGGDTV